MEVVDDYVTTIVVAKDKPENHFKVHITRGLKEDLAAIPIAAEAEITRVITEFLEKDM